MEDEDALESLLGDLGRPQPAGKGSGGKVLRKPARSVLELRCRQGHPSAWVVPSADGLYLVARQGEHHFCVQSEDRGDGRMRPIALRRLPIALATHGSPQRRSSGLGHQRGHRVTDLPVLGGRIPMEPALVRMGLDSGTFTR